MPLSHRRGITAKESAKESLRRQEARENGIVLERALRTPKRSSDKRDRGVEKPSVGKFRNGMLKLSRKDVHSIQGPNTGGVGQRRKGRR